MFKSVRNTPSSLATSLSEAWMSLNFLSRSMKAQQQ